MTTAGPRRDQSLTGTDGKHGILAPLFALLERSERRDPLSHRPSFCSVGRRAGKRVLLSGPVRP